MVLVAMDVLDFYGTIDVYMDPERDIADFLRTESSILYSKGFSIIPCVIPAFSVVPFAGSIIMTSEVWKTCS